MLSDPRKLQFPGWTFFQDFGRFSPLRLSDFYHEILLTKASKVLEILFQFKAKSKRKPDRVLRSFNQLMSNPYLFCQLSNRIPSHSQRVGFLEKIFAAMVNIAYLYHEYVDFENLFTSIYPVHEEETAKSEDDMETEEEAAEGNSKIRKQVVSDKTKTGRALRRSSENALLVTYEVCEKYVEKKA